MKTWLIFMMMTMSLKKKFKLDDLTFETGSHLGFHSIFILFNNLFHLEVSVEIFLVRFSHQSILRQFNCNYFLKIFELCT